MADVQSIEEMKVSVWLMDTFQLIVQKGEVFKNVNKSAMEHKKSEDLVMKQFAQLVSTIPDYLTEIA